ncbi:MAG: imidazolonepropionase [Nitrospinaceae bacterium]|nr:MAG: imidazolonepropionase [Nitrospinaceae bacterium]
MEKIICFRNIGELIQVDPDGETPKLVRKTNCALLVKDGRVHKVVKDSGIDPKIYSKVLDLQGRAVIPGLVDCHTHLIYAGERKDEMEQRASGTPYMEILKNGGGILSTVKATRQATEEALYDSAKKRVRRMMTLGTTAFEIKSGYGLDLNTEMKMLKVGQRLRKDLKIPVTLTYLGAHAAPKGQKIGPYFEFVMEHLPKFRNLADGVDIFCERDVFTVAHLRRLFLHAKLVGFHQLRAHVEELSHQGGCFNAARLGAISCDHLEHATAHDIRAMQMSGTTAVLMPGVTFFLGGKRIPLVQTMIDAGVTLALATDCNPGSSPSYNMQTVLTLAQSLYRISPELALIAATYGSARALDGQNDYGGLLPGQRADFLVLKTNDYRDIFYYFGENFVAQTWSAGKKVKGENDPVAF